MGGERPQAVSNLRERELWCRGEWGGGSARVGYGGVCIELAQDQRGHHGCPRRG
jgi:hypothetical protein